MITKDESAISIIQDENVEYTESEIDSKKSYRVTYLNDSNKSQTPNIYYEQLFNSYFVRDDKLIINNDIMKVTLAKNNENTSYVNTGGNLLCDVKFPASYSDYVPNYIGLSKEILNNINNETSPNIFSALLSFAHKPSNYSCSSIYDKFTNLHDDKDINSNNANKVKFINWNYGYNDVNANTLDTDVCDMTLRINKIIDYIIDSGYTLGSNVDKNLSNLTMNLVVDIFKKSITNTISDYKLSSYSLNRGVLPALVELLTDEDTMLKYITKIKAGDTIFPLGKLKNYKFANKWYPTYLCNQFKGVKNDDSEIYANCMGLPDSPNSYEGEWMNASNKRYTLSFEQSLTDVKSFKLQNSESFISASAEYTPGETYSVDEECDDIFDNDNNFKSLDLSNIINTKNSFLSETPEVIDYFKNGINVKIDDIYSIANNTGRLYGTVNSPYYKDVKIIASQLNRKAGPIKVGETVKKSVLVNDGLNQYKRDADSVGSSKQLKVFKFDSLFELSNIKDKLETADILLDFNLTSGYLPKVQTANVPKSFPVFRTLAYNMNTNFDTSWACKNVTKVYAYDKKAAIKNINVYNFSKDKYTEIYNYIKTTETKSRITKLLVYLNSGNTIDIIKNLKDHADLTPSLIFQSMCIPDSNKKVEYVSEQHNRNGELEKIQFTQQLTSINVSDINVTFGHLVAYSYGYFHAQNRAPSGNFVYMVGYTPKNSIPNYNAQTNNCGKENAGQKNITNQDQAISPAGGNPSYQVCYKINTIIPEFIQETEDGVVKNVVSTSGGINADYTTMGYSPIPNKCNGSFGPNDMVEQMIKQNIYLLSYDGADTDTINRLVKTIITRIEIETEDFQYVVGSFDEYTKSAIMATTNNTGFSNPSVTTTFEFLYDVSAITNTTITNWLTIVYNNIDIILYNILNAIQSDIEKFALLHRIYKYYPEYISKYHQSWRDGVTIYDMPFLPIMARASTSATNLFGDAKTVSKLTINRNNDFNFTNIETSSMIAAVNIERQKDDSNQYILKINSNIFNHLTSTSKIAGFVAYIPKHVSESMVLFNNNYKNQDNIDYLVLEAEGTNNNLSELSFITNSGYIGIINNNYVSALVDAVVMNNSSDSSKYAPLHCSVFKYAVNNGIIEWKLNTLTSDKDNTFYIIYPAKQDLEYTVSSYDIKSKISDYTINQKMAICNYDTIVDLPDDYTPFKL